MAGRLSGRGFGGPLTRPHGGGLEGGARVASALAGMLLIGAGVLHISAAGDHTNLPVMLAGFLVVAVLQAGLGGLLLFRRAGALVLAAGLALTLGALATWLVSRTAGLPLLPGGHMEPIGFKDGVTVVFEVATTPLLALLVSAELDQVRLPSPRLGTQAVAVLASGMFALFVPALVLGGGGHHSADEMAHMHGADAEELAHTGGGHAHGDEATASGHGHEHSATHSEHSDGEHPHGQPASTDVLAAAHESATGHHTDPTELGLTHEPASHEHSGGSGEQTHQGSDHGGGGHDHDSGSGDSHGDSHDGGEQESGHHDGSGDHGSGDHDSGDHTAEPAAEEGTIAFEQREPAQDGSPARGSALVVYGRADEEANGPGHAHETCEPTATEQAAADGIVADVSAELKQYENNPAEALADGFNYVFGPTDRMIHMVHTPRVDDPDVLNAGEIESFIYYMTDTGFVPIGGMFVMPDEATSGPEPGGCLTQWHHHGGLIGRWATAGTSDTTPLMMHVFTYPGLDPWGHYNGRDLAALWTPGGWVPSVCRSAADANNGCLP